MSDWRLELSPAQVGRMREELVAIIERYESATPDQSAEPVRLILHLLPQRRKERP
jgi:hypothetical protein